MEMKLYQRVAFVKDMPGHNLIKGDVDAVVEHLPTTKDSGGEEGYVLEVSNAVGETINVVIVSAAAVEPRTEEEILHVRPLYPTQPSKSQATTS